MSVKATVGACSLTAYKGTSTTLLALDMNPKPDNTFAGFTIEYTNSDGRRPIQNMINFDGTDEIRSSEVAPIQMFRWVHFPGSYHQKDIILGSYTYHATPRYLDNNGNLKPLDSALTVSVTIDVGDFSSGNLKIGFTRAFLKSQAFAKRYGSTTPLIPKDASDWIFKTTAKAGTNDHGDFTYEDMYTWLGFNARTMVYDMIDRALKKKSITVDMFVYDFNDPILAQNCLKLAKEGRIRMIMDNADLHSGIDPKTDEVPEEDDFETRFNKVKKGKAQVFRCRFARYSHCKVIILRDNGKPISVLTGSTNFSVTGLYINANHVLVFEDRTVAKYYADVFDEVWLKGNAPAFRLTDYARTPAKFSTNVPKMDVNFSPHDEAIARKLLDGISKVVTAPKTNSVFFAVMEMGPTSTGSLIPALRQVHQNDNVFSYGITDKADELSLYKPGVKDGVLVNAKKANAELPPPFDKEHSLGTGGPGQAHAIHHKFVVTNFNKADAKTYCGSSNLALGGEKENGDNLICIQDSDVSTVFAIEAMRLTDHYNFRSLKQGTEPVKLNKTGAWFQKYYKDGDLRCVERKLFGG